MRKLPFLLTKFIFRSGRKIPLLPTQNPGKCLLLTPPPLYSQTQTRIPIPMHTMRAIKNGGNSGIFLCIVPIIQSHMSKWYSTTKSPKYAQ